MATKRQPDTIRAAVVARAAALNLNAREIAEATGGTVSEDTVYRFLRGTNDPTASKLDAIFRALNLSVAQPEHV